MLTDFALVRRAWRFGDAKYVAAYGLVNMAFMLVYFLASGCPVSPACDLDAQGHPYVYSVVDWRAPLHATLACLLAIFIPVPLISRFLSALSTGRKEDTEDTVPYPFGANHNGTVRLPKVSHAPTSVAEVSAILRERSAAESVRAVGSAKSNTRCLEVPGAMLRVEMAEVQVAKDRASATAGAGCTLRDLAHALAAAGLQLYSTVEIGNLTAGAMAVSHTKNRHIPGEKGILSSYVSGVTLVDGHGRIHRISEGEARAGGAFAGGEHTVDGVAADEAVWGAPAELMRHVRTSHGLLGVVCDVTVRVKPLGGRSISHSICRGAEAFAAVAVRHAESGSSIFAYFSPYDDRYLVERQADTHVP
eukprot:3182940-Prymnesium_polylepis.1